MKNSETQSNSEFFVFRKKAKKRVFGQ
jgi:hypothetical protein